jgi:hypothetical protein
MSTVGSIIFNKNGDVTILTPLVDNRDLIKVLMRGERRRSTDVTNPLCVWDLLSLT